MNKRLHAMVGLEVGHIYLMRFTQFTYSDTLNVGEKAGFQNS